MRYTFIAIMLLLITSQVSATDDFGRLFTTQEQRHELDVLRYHKEVVQVDIELDQDVESNKEANKEPGQPIRLKGIIYRKDGNNAAWINNANTLRGDLSLENIKVEAKDISPDHVRITLPEGRKTIRLKVGEQYLPDNDRDDNMIP